MRTALLAAACFMTGTLAFAQHPGAPCPELSIVEVAPPPLGCQYRFNAIGTFDELLVVAALRDCNGNPVPGYAVEVALDASGALHSLCGCEPLVQTALSDADGNVTFRFRRLGGHGALRACVSSADGTAFRIGCADAPFTSPDLNASCEPGASTTVIDLGLWAAGLAAYDRASDYDCSSTNDVVDLALWASGLGVGCE